jgi:bifunctional ADP-heptose synthase (sugar kinase/adenylyltransferase)
MDEASREFLSHKVKTVDELVALVGPRPRDKKVIMCHGVFDVVHPGHIRHLLYAKSKGSVLVASLTADRHIMKANMRPYIPEDIRALNLAALEMVDYVIIDPNSTPLANIAAIQPDFFAKGYEYGKDNMLHPKTQDEISVLEGYGGEVIFTPGDVVYSSSALIEMQPPDISIEKLNMLMMEEKITFNDLRSILEKFKGMRAHVVGDAIVDSYSYCAMIGGQSKTPTISVRFEHKDSYVGGAEVTFSTVLGEDADAAFVRKDLNAAGIVMKDISDPTRPTTNKNAIITEGYRMLKVDTLDNRTISDKICARFCSQIADTETDALVFSDFRHGIFNRATVPILAGAIPQGQFKVADSQVASRWGNILEFQGFDLLTPNEREARFALGDQDSHVRPLATSLFSQANCRTLILKLGDRGILTYRTRPADDPRTFAVIDSFVDRVVDAVGAGDALLAYSSLALKLTGNDIVASILGSIAAGIECEHDGNIPVTLESMRKKIDAIERIAVLK